MPDSEYSPALNDECGKVAKRIGNFSLAVAAAILATAGSGHASTVRPAVEAQAPGSSVQAPIGPSRISGLGDLIPSTRSLIGYGNYYTNWHDYSNHSNYNNYYSNWADYSNVPKKR